MNKARFITLLFFFFVFVSCGNRSGEGYSYEDSEDYLENDYYGEDEAYNEEDYIAVAYQEREGVKLLPVKINGLGFFMIIDTGCSTNLISRLEVAALVKNGLLTKEDFIGTTKSYMADGSVVEMPVIRLKQVIVGDKILFTNVEAVVADNISADLLLGNEILNRVNSFEIDNDEQVIKFKLR